MLSHEQHSQQTLNWRQEYFNDIKLCDQHFAGHKIILGGQINLRKLEYVEKNIIQDKKNS